MVSTVGANNLDDAEIDIRAQASVQAHFLGAIGRALLGRREIDEAKIDWLLQFVCEAAGEDDPGDMRVAQHQIIGGMVVRLRSQEANHIVRRADLRVPFRGR